MYLVYICMYAQINLAGSHNKQFCSVCHVYIKQPASTYTAYETIETFGKLFETIELDLFTKLSKSPQALYDTIKHLYNPAINTYIHIYIYTHVYICICVYMYIHTYMHAYMHTHVYIYTYTHICPLSSTRTTSCPSMRLARFTASPMQPYHNVFWRLADT